MNNPSQPATETGFFSRVLFILAIPWCCVLSVTLTLLATSGSMIGIVFDEAFHEWMPVVLAVLVPTHIYGIYRYAKYSCKSRGRTLFLIFTTLLFILSIGFHFTDIHDQIIGHDHHHENH